ncbi:MAG TPA: peptidylprolyl isomerase [Cyclobacteriaceae bacterium]|jgi:peptidyl-prolyl cis-trans isomerase B (cyclophilin B)|nr:peptidylprolyl isomerase [Cyclobacteriaceae bacterium]
MKRLHLLLLAFAISFFGCGEKEVILVTNENKGQVLADYGKTNPEKEALIETEFGNISVRLYDETPLHRANFIKLIKDEYYEDAEFYRVVEKFVVQGGVPLKKLDYTIPAEFNPAYFHKKGALAMARLDENNPGMESSSTEFYFVHGDRYTDSDFDEDQKNFGLTLSPEQRKLYTTIGGEMSLDQKYTVFGEITDGLDVIDKIATVRVYVEKPYKKIPFKISIKK